MNGDEMQFGEKLADSGGFLHQVYTSWVLEVVSRKPGQVATVNIVVDTH